MLNAAPVPEKKRGPGIFQRMTGTSWAKKDIPITSEEPQTASSSPVSPPKPVEQSIEEEPVKAVETEVPKVEITEQLPETTSVEIPEPAPEAIIETKTQIEADMETEPKPEPTVAPPVAEKPVTETQPRLRGVEPQERLPNSQSEEDLLEIPAFLRRQAN